MGVRSRYQTEHEAHGRVAANHLLSNLSATFKFGTACVEGSDSELCAFGKRHADNCTEILARIPDLVRAYDAITRFVESYGLEAGKVTNRCRVVGAVLRMCDEHWWRRAVRKKYGRTVEGFAIGAGFVHRRRAATPVTRL